MSTLRIILTAVSTIALSLVLLLMGILCFYKVLIVGVCTFLALNVAAIIIEYIKKKKTLRDIIIELTYLGILCILELVIIVEAINILDCF